MFGHTFKRYEIRAELGIGGMATVYRAYDPSFEREVALKVLKRELVEDAALRERFARETKIIAKLEHAAIVPVYDVDFDNNQLFYIMRYMHGGSLTERIESKQLDLEQISYILLRLADALDYAHRKGVVHRDLKPGNILFDESNNAYISDFGIAKFAKAATRLTHSGIIGTPRYMSPEQALGEEVDGRSDQYSLGVIMFEMLSGQAPFDADTPLIMALKHATEPAPNIVEVNPNLPPEIGEVFKKILAKEPDQRYVNVAEFANGFLDALPPSTLPISKLITPLPPRPPPGSTASAEPKPEMPRSTSRRGLIGGVLALALIGLAILGYFGFAAPSPITVTASITPSATLTPFPTLTNTPSPTVTPEPTAIPVDPGIGGATRIALVTNREVYVMDMDGRNRAQLTNTKVQKYNLQWLPGGRELLYREGNCIYTVNAEDSNPQPAKLGCYQGNNFTGFRVSQDGKYTAISIANRLIVLPFNLDFLSTAKETFDLQNWDQTCIDYADATDAVRAVQWSTDGKSLAVKYQSLINNRLGESIRILDVNLIRCKSVQPLTIAQFPNNDFTPQGYETFPILPAYDWDGNQRFLFNTLIRNSSYGALYLFDTASQTYTHLTPAGDCCYRSATFSPDGAYMLFLFQDRSQGSNSQTVLYYMPLDDSTKPVRIRVPLEFFSNVREETLFALQPAMP